MVDPERPKAKIASVMEDPSAQAIARVQESVQTTWLCGTPESWASRRSSSATHGPSFHAPLRIAAR